MWKDDRTNDQVVTHTHLVGGRDSFMSGWGLAPGISYAYWACTDDQLPLVEKWVYSRDDQPRPKVIDESRLPTLSKGDQGHVYCIRDGHPALQGISSRSPKRRSILRDLAEVQSRGIGR